MIRRITRTKNTIAVAFGLSLALLPLGTAVASSPFKLPACPAQADDEKQVLPAIKIEQEEKQDVGKHESPEQELRSEANSSSGGKKKPNSNLNHFDRAKNINLVPLPLIPSRTELEERQKLTLERHKEQLKDLWTAAIERSPDIQFAISVLQPNSNPKHATAAAMKLVGSAIFNVGGTMAPNSATRTAVSMGSPIINRLFQQEKGTPAVTVGETLVLYKMVRDIADNLVSSYWNYRKTISERDAAECDLCELNSVMQRILKESNDTDLHFLYLQHKAERDIQVCNETVGIYEQHLLDLCGQNAIAKLQVQIDEEKKALAQLVGRPDINNPLTIPSKNTANGNKD